jgi:hypothetical protein
MQSIGFSLPRLLTCQEQSPESELGTVINTHGQDDRPSVSIDLKRWNRCEIDVAMITVNQPQSL